VEKANDGGLTVFKMKAAASAKLKALRPEETK
jgi:hypothetical protein